MNNFLDPVTATVALRLFVALILGMIIGIERVWAHKTAGMRTYALVAMGSALFMILSEELVKAYYNLPGTNPLMVAAQIVLGVGFLGSGLIYSKDSKNFGFTTAASLWVSAGIGMAAGFGLFNIAFIASILTLFVFTVLWFIEEKLKKSKFFKDENPGDMN